MSDRTNPDPSRHGTEDGGEVATAQEAGQIESRFPDPGLPAHVYRRTDVDERAAKRAERQVAGLFVLSFLGSVAFVVFYFTIRLDGGVARASLSTIALGASLGVAIFCVGLAAVHWAKKLMPDDEIVEERHVIRSPDEDRAAAAGIIAEGGEGAGFGRRPLIWGSMLASFGLLLAPVVVLLRDLGPLPQGELSRTAWRPGRRIVRDPQGTPIRPADIPIGGVLHVLPEGLEDEEGFLEEKAKAATILIRLEPEEWQPVDPERIGWAFDGIVAFSKICTHVGCPVGLYEQTTHHLLCPCHQSTFDVPRACEVIFGPAGRPLPQLAIAVDEEGYLVSQMDFVEPIGPTYWERG